MTCKGICVRYKAQKPVGTGRYASGQRRCQICEIFIKWEGLWCPCCGYRLRTKPRNLKYKAKLRLRVEADSIEAKQELKLNQILKLKFQWLNKKNQKQKLKVERSKTSTKNKRKTACQYCGKLDVYPENMKRRAAKKNIKNLDDIITILKSESIAIKA